MSERNPPSPTEGDQESYEIRNPPLPDIRNPPPQRDPPPEKRDPRPEEKPERQPPDPLRTKKAQALHPEVREYEG